MGCLLVFLSGQKDVGNKRYLGSILFRRGVLLVLPEQLGSWPCVYSRKSLHSITLSFYITFIGHWFGPRIRVVV